MFILFQLGLAEELKKPIIALKLEDPREMDPGLKLVVQRRQVSKYVYTVFVPLVHY